MKIIAILSVFLLLLILFIIVKAQPQGRHVSISQHAAMKTWTYWIFGLSLSLFGGIFLFFLQTSFSETVGMPQYLTFLYPVIWIFLFGTAWVPDTGKGKLSKTHQIAGLSIALWMTIIMANLPFAKNVPMFVRFVTIVISLWYAYTWYLFFFVKKSRQNFLVYQTINVVSLFTVIVAISLL